MRKHRRDITQVSSFIVLVALILQLNLITSAQRPIVISADQPNVWTLEQAHYLLAQMHRRNLDLRAEKLDDLDANAINGVSIDLLKTLLETSAEYDQAKGFTNKQLKNQKEFEANRRQQLLARRSDLEDQSLTLTRQIAELKIKKLQAKDDIEKENFQAQIDQLEIVQAAAKEQITQTNTELGTLNAPSGDFQAVSPSGGFDKSKFADSLDSIFATTAKTVADGFANSPQLNASLRLDNYLQMQYEILSKQLTLLRDEVGPGERLLFMEMPQSINTSYDKADNKWAQSWWRIRGYTCERDSSNPQQCKVRPKLTTTPTLSPTPQTPTPAQGGAPREGQMRASTPTPTPTPTPLPGPPNIRTPSVLEGLNSIFSVPTPTPITTPNPASAIPLFRDLNTDTPSPVIFEDAMLRNILQNRVIRVVDMFPRQSSLNVNTLKTRSSAFSFKLLFTLLSGFGGNANYQRQREQYSQFVQQELYSSAFGKGSREFGWTFNPMPGTKRLMSGVRTTYAVLVIPEEASRLVVESTGCYFKRHLPQPYNFADAITWINGNNESNQGCYDRKGFVITVPDGGPEDRGFWVESIYYKPAKKGDRVVVVIKGEDFSSQIGVLVNGVALPQALGLAQPFILDDSTAGEEVKKIFRDEKIRGGFERIGSDQIIASFSMQEDYVGTPVITLVAPGKAIDLNRLPLTVNSATTSLDAADFMFGKRAGTNATAIKVDRINIFEIKNAAGNTTSLNAVITGENLETTRVTGLYVNALDCVAGNGCTHAVHTDTHIRVNFVPPVENSIFFTLLGSNNETFNAEPVDNPAVPDDAEASFTANSALLRVEKVKFLEYQNKSGGSGIVMVVQLTGVGFTDELEVDNGGELIVISPTRAILKIDKSKLPEVITLTNEQLGITAKAIIMGKPLREEP